MMEAVAMGYILFLGFLAFHTFTMHPDWFLTNAQIRKSLQVKSAARQNSPDGRSRDYQQRRVCGDGCCNAPDNPGAYPPATKEETPPGTQAKALTVPNWLNDAINHHTILSTR